MLRKDIAACIQIYRNSVDRLTSVGLDNVKLKAASFDRLCESILYLIDEREDKDIDGCD